MDIPQELKDRHQQVLNSIRKLVLREYDGWKQELIDQDRGDEKIIVHLGAGTSDWRNIEINLKTDIMSVTDSRGSSSHNVRGCAFTNTQLASQTLSKFILDNLYSDRDRIGNIIGELKKL